MPQSTVATDICARLSEAIVGALGRAGIEGVLPVLDRPARPEHGDWATNVALVAAGRSGRKPRELADALAADLRATLADHVAAVEVAGPGFVNFRLGPGWWAGLLRQVVDQGTAGYARLDVLAGTRVDVEFVSANPTGPLHAGAGRWAAYGDSLCRVLERCGATVEREYFVNDRGGQVVRFGESLAARRRGEPVPEDGYQGDYVTAWAAEMPADADPVAWGCERAKRDIAETLDLLGVHFDRWSSEKALVDDGTVDDTLRELRERGAVYESEGALWLRSTDHGDTKDRVLVKSDGDLTYLLPDIAYHRDKFARGFDLLVDVWGADHHGYVARMQAAMQALGHDPAQLEVVLGQLVTLERDGQPVRLSKRTGDMLELRELLGAVGPDVARIVFLLQSIETHQTVDLDRITRQSSESPAFYVQYAHARIASLEREATRQQVARQPIGTCDLGVLVHEREAAVLRSLSELPDVVQAAAASRAPHQVCTWVRQLAQRFHAFYHDCPVLRHPDPAVVQARLWLVEATRVGLAIGLDLLGIHTPDLM